MTTLSSLNSQFYLSVAQIRCLTYFDPEFLYLSYNINGWKNRYCIFNDFEDISFTNDI